MPRSLLRTLTTFAICLILSPLEAAPRISARSVVVLDESSNRAFYSKAPRLRRAPASTSKLLTAMITLDRLDPDQSIKIPRMVRNIPPSKVYLRPGEKFKVRELLKAMLMQSANDAAAVLAIAIAGSRKNFAPLMNAKAQSIGCKHSNFIRPNGLPARGQLTTAYDMALITRAATDYDFIIDTMRRKRATILSESGRRIALRNSNRLLWQPKFPVIGKTGFTRRARHCFVGIVSVGSGELYLSVLGSRSRRWLWRDVKNIVRSRLRRLKRTISTNYKLWTSDTKRRAIQHNLQRAGFEVGPVDGVFGVKTISAVRAFQSEAGLTVDGIVGKKTWEALSSSLMGDLAQGS